MKKILRAIWMTSLALHALGAGTLNAEEKPGREHAAEQIQVLEERLAEVEGVDNERALEVLTNLGTLYEFQGKLVEARSYYERALALEGKVPPSTGLFTRTARDGLNRLAPPNEPELEAQLRRRLGAASPGDRRDAVADLYRHLLEVGRAAEGTDLLLQEVERLKGPHACASSDACEQVGDYLRALGKLAQSHGQNHLSVNRLEKAIEAYQKAPGYDGKSSRALPGTWSDLGSALRATGRVDDAERAYRTSIDLWKLRLGAEVRPVDSVLEALAEVVEMRGDAKQAASLRAKAKEIRERDSN